MRAAPYHALRPDVVRSHCSYMCIQTTSGEKVTTVCAEDWAARVRRGPRDTHAWMKQERVNILPAEVSGRKRSCVMEQG